MDMTEPKGEVLGSFENCGTNFPVTLFTYWDGSMDLHAQTGEGHVEAIGKAVAELKKRGLEVRHSDFMGGTGMYYSVRPAGTYPADKLWTPDGSKRGWWVMM
jgi:Ser/Thr protein kinase RdoA (MazF antagonist)